MLTGKPPSEKSLQMFTERMNTSLNNVENLWLADGRPYLTGNQISAADIFAACEIEQVGKCKGQKFLPKAYVFVLFVNFFLSCIFSIWWT